MKISRLPDTDLARIAPLTLDEQIKQLRLIREKEIRMSYQQLRSVLPELFNMGSDLLGPSKPSPWKFIAKRLQKKCRRGIELEANLRAAKSLYQYANSEGIHALKQEFPPLRLGIHQEVRFWQQMLILIDGKPFIPFIEPRTSYGLSNDGRVFAFSMMHEHIRASDPDYSDVGFTIFQLGKPSKNPDTGEKTRSTRVYFDHSVDLLSMEELEKMAATTYGLWAEVLAEKDAPAAPATGTGGLLL
ncbi:type VI toxin-antitoxin system SocB family DNA replication inhibitor toxin [Thalassospira lucentensis]|uniref:type VI toxin-antitoxin system SocB family DNA replication inhibitor toxin n=1 Tax=Thalassospira lucentensis TaxID=168935 RepID=UPI003D2EBDAD